MLLIAIYYVEDTPQSNSPTVASNDDNATSGYADNIDNYEQARSVFWRELYPSGNTLYCDMPFDGSRRDGINVEHIFPMSWATNGLDCGTRNQCRDNSRLFNQIEADLHNLYPSRTEVNSARSSYAFAEINGESRQFGRDCDFEVSEQQRLAEPRPEIRGDVARAMFYMAYRYKDQGLVLFSRQARLLQDWHQSDPPGNSEKSRNDAIAAIQNNRNPFVDDPDYLNNLVVEGYFF